MSGWGSLNLEILRGGGASSSFGNPGGSVGQKTQSRSQQEKNTARAVTKICCQVNTSRWGIKQLRISFGSIFHLFSYESSWGKSPAPTT